MWSKIRSTNSTCTPGTTLAFAPVVKTIFFVVKLKNSSKNIEQQQKY
jgi:hypothetical protein